MKRIPIDCPSCGLKLKVAKLVCDHCETEVSGKFSLPVLVQLSLEEQEFILNFLRHSGSLKEMAAQLGKSYPTVRNILDDLIFKINMLKNEE